MKHTNLNGISYVHFYNPATTTDAEGISIFSTKVKTNGKTLEAELK